MSETAQTRRERRLDRLSASSVWTRLIATFVLVGPWMLAIGPAVYGVPSGTVVLWVLLGAFVGTSVRERAFLVLPLGSRRTVIAVQRSGQLSGDAALDQIALARLRRATRTPRVDRVLIRVLVVLYAAIPVVAAVRDSSWWLLCLLPGVVAVALGGVSWPPESARTRRDRLERASARR